MSVRTSRTRLITAAASVALAAFTMTACGDNGEIKSAGPAPSVRFTSFAGAPTSPAADPAAPPASAAPGSTAPGSTASKPAANAPANASPNAPANTSAPKAPAAPAATKPTTCEGSNTKTIAAPLNRPVNHMLLTVTNTGSGICYLHGYPAVRFGEAQAVPPVITDSKPQAVVTLKPGESGYASVNLSSTDGTDGSNGHTVTSLAVYFHGPSGNESVGAGANPALPPKGVYVDDSLKVTYWQQSMDDAVSW
ncbi:DUF4232 domain-containing protein [Kitasatospora sp. NPDC048545]|uniref:DUF4232 domain-containing protein n=1 Tax=Kitasatospora sp. NPDC048545 TaxID=3157208 RepID=UPI0033EA67C8